jgi:hypothetical protein
VNWTDIPFDIPFGTTPKVFAEVISENGGDTIEVDLQQVGQVKFKARIEEDLRAGWDGGHSNETISWYATAEAGSATYQLGTSTQGTGTCPGSGTPPWCQISFSPAFSGVPKVFADIQSENGADTAAIDIRNVTASGFELRLEEDVGAGWDGFHGNETIAWMAFETAPLGQSGTVTAGSTTVPNQWNTGGVAFAPSFGSVPKMLAEINSENGTQTVQVDIRNLTVDGADIRVEEEPKRYDGLHAPETGVVWFAWE